MENLSTQLKELFEKHHVTANVPTWLGGLSPPISTVRAFACISPTEDDLEMRLFEPSGVAQLENPQRIAVGAAVAAAWCEARALMK